MPRYLKIAPRQPKLRARLIKVGSRRKKNKVRHQTLRYKGPKVEVGPGTEKKSSGAKNLGTGANKLGTGIYNFWPGAKKLGSGAKKIGTGAQNLGPGT